MPRSVKKIHTLSLPKIIQQHSNGHHHEPSLPALEHQYSQAITETDVEEVWFAGVHCGMFILCSKTIDDILGIVQTSGVDLSQMTLVTVWRAFRYGG